MYERDRSVIGIGEMAQRLGLHRSTTSRLAATLAAAGYLEPAGEPGRYRLSGKLAALGELVAADGQLRRAALPSASPGPIHGSGWRASRRWPMRCAAPRGRSAPGSALPARYRDGAFTPATAFRGLGRMGTLAEAALASG